MVALDVSQTIMRKDSVVIAKPSTDHAYCDKRVAGIVTRRLSHSCETMNTYPQILERMEQQRWGAKTDAVMVQQRNQLTTMTTKLASALKVENEQVVPSPNSKGLDNNC